MASAVPSTDVTMDAVVGGVIQPEFTGSIDNDGDRGYLVVLNSQTAFPTGAKVDVLSSFADLAISENVAADMFTFYIMGAGDGGYTTRNVVTPLAYPTIFDPGREDTRLYFPLKEDTEITLKIFNLSGVLVYETDYSGLKGNNFILWDGVDLEQNDCANGVYFFYITTGRDHKVIGRGKVMIMRGDPD